ncbi:hypothetical protein OIU77_027118 [Salix suchowensis]|uniref:Uncharacterized protein n=1 Tax=Salix suchowensis TaxID=1278906 RepID=A0ABQ9BR05_9ROSI|nr:hypothetical protein OIU77_027118 [Salix suchowensis]
MPLDWFDRRDEFFQQVYFVERNIVVSSMRWRWSHRQQQRILHLGYRVRRRRIPDRLIESSCSVNLQCTEPSFI